MAVQTKSAEVAERVTRIRHSAWTDDDLAWLRAVEAPPPVPGWAIDRERRIRLLCDCRCRCHLGGSCSNPIYMDELDCRMACRSAHILASDCNLDENRPTDV